MFEKLRNLSFLSAEPVFRLASGLVILLVVARQLGPEAFGTFSYAMALIAIFQAFARFGQEGAIMRRVGLEPDSAPATFASSMVLTFGMSLVAALACIGFLAFGWSAGGNLAAVAPFIALAVLVMPGEVAFGILKVREKVGQAVTLRMVVAIAALAGLVWLAIRGAGADDFIVLRVVEIVAGALVLLVLAWMLVRGNGPLAISGTRLRQLAADGLPLLANGLLAVAMLRIDQLMIAPLAGGEELGRYGVAVRVAEMGNFLPAALSGALFAAASRNVGEETGSEAYFQRFFDLYVLCGIALALVLGLAGWLLLVPVLGGAYAASLPMMLVLLASTPLFFANSAFAMLRNLRGWLWNGVALTAAALVANVAANFVLIPQLGGLGAAIATVLSLAIVGLGGALCLRRTRQAGIGMVRAFNPVGASMRLWKLYRPLVAKEDAAVQGSSPQ